MSEELPKGAILIRRHPSDDDAEMDEEALPKGAIPIDDEELPPGAIPVEHFDEGGIAGDIVTPPASVQDPLKEEEEELPQASTSKRIPDVLDSFGHGVKSGFTLGANAVVKTKGVPALGIPSTHTPEEIREIQDTNPVSNFLGELVGTGALVGLTGGATSFAALARLGWASQIFLEGAAIGGINRFNDDWSQNKPLDAEKIAASAGIGGLLSVGVGAVIRKVFGSSLQNALISEPKIKPPAGGGGGGGEPIVDAPSDLENWSIKSTQEIAEDISQPVVAPRTADPAPKTIAEMAERNEKSRLDKTGEPTPHKDVAVDALGRVGNRLEPFPVLPYQIEALENQATRDVVGYRKIVPDKIGNTLRQYEANQKYGVLVPKIQSTIENLSPGYVPATSSSEAGARVAGAFTKVLEPLKEQYGKLIGALKKVNIEDIDHLPNLLFPLMKRLPVIAQMIRLDRETGKYSVRAWNARMDIAPKAYKNIKSVLTAMIEKNPTLEDLFALRKNLGNEIDLTTTRNGASELTSAKKVMMDYIQELIQKVSPNAEVREAFKGYAKTLEAIELVESEFGAEIGTENFRSLAKGNPDENILGKIFLNSETVKSAKQILGRDEFNKVLVDYLNLAKEKFTNLGEFSSNRFGTFLKSKADMLKEAFADNPNALQDIKDFTTLARVFPDAAPVVLGSGKTILHTLGKMSGHDFTVQGLLSSLPKKALKEVGKYYENQELNRIISGQAEKAYWSSSLKNSSEKITKDLDKKIELLFKGIGGTSKVTQDD